jgi:hypothetical protein
MSRIRVIVLLMLCLTIPMAGWASALGGQFCLSQTGSSESHTGAAHRHIGHQPTARAVAEQDDADCDHEACDDGHCKHKCPPGCNMSMCASPSLALAGLPIVFLWIATTDAIHPLAGHPLDAMRGTSPLRPPIL